MKYTKKILALLLALTMVFAMAVTVGADEAAIKPGSITINNAVVGQVYKAYRILELESYEATSGAYSYKANSSWSSFIASEAIQNVYLKTDTQGYVTWVGNADVAAFAKLAQAYAADSSNSVTENASTTADSTTVTFSNLDLGYYLVDTSLGSLCALDTTNPNATMEEKNEAPTIEKKVQEDSNNTWGDQNDADIGQTVNFKTTVHAKKGAQNYVVHDQMSTGLSLKAESIKVQVNSSDVATSNYTVTTTDLNDGCTFEIKFGQSYLDTITSDTEIVITYSAELNAGAVVEGTGNTNKTKLDYGDISSTEWAETHTYTWKFGVFKYTNGEGEAEMPLAGAKFKLYKKVDGTEKYVTATEIEDDNSKATGYKVTGWADTAEGGTEFVSPEDGKFAIIGLDADTYYLKETDAPAGYNKLSSDVTVVIDKTFSGDNNMTGTTKVSKDTTAVSNGEVKVLNQTGTELPSTGGIGTTIFYVLGSALVLAAVVLLVTKKRMNAENA